MYGKMREPGLIENHFFDVLLSYREPVSWLSHPEFPSGLPVLGDYSGSCLPPLCNWMMSTFFALMVKAEVQGMFDRPQDRLFELAYSSN